MRMATLSYIKQLKISKQKDNMQYVMSMCLLLATLIIARAIHHGFFYVFAAVSLVAFACSSISHCFSLLLFLLPSGTILKMNINDISFFTVLFFVVVLKMIFAKKIFNRNMVFLIMAFAVYAVVFSGIGRVTTIVSMVAGLLMLYCLRTETINVNISIMSFALGIVFASILALMKDSLPYISMFVNDVLYRFAEDGYSSRFAGLQGNPNYYTMDIIVVLAVLITIMTYRETRRTHILCVVVLSIFGLMSISKSFLISLVLLLVFWLFLSIRQGGTKLTNFILVACIGSALVYFYAYDSINLYMQRFAVDSGSSLSDMTTGRTDIWKDYMNTIWHDPKILLFGNGLKSLIYTGRGAHNTYIEAFFSLGIVGVSLFCIILRKCTGKILVKPIMWIPVSMLLFRMFGITILTYDNLWFYLAIFVLLAKDMQDNSITKREG